MNITIRKATPSDFASLFTLIHELAHFQGTPERVVNTVDQMKEEKDFFHCFVAETDEKEIVGMALYFFSYYTWVGKSIYLDDLYVKESFRGHKIGSRLLEKLFDVARKEKCKRVRWLVSEWNKPAIEFYKSIGSHIETDAWVCDVEGNSIDRMKEKLAY
jgi:diamine N-acetyltransferase